MGPLQTRPNSSAHHPIHQTPCSRISYPNAQRPCWNKRGPIWWMNSGDVTSIPNGVSWSAILPENPAQNTGSKDGLDPSVPLGHRHTSVSQIANSACVQCLPLMPVPVISAVNKSSQVKSGPKKSRRELFQTQDRYKMAAKTITRLQPSHVIPPAPNFIHIEALRGYCRQGSVVVTLW